MLKRFYSSLFIHKRFFIGFATLILGYIFSFFFEWLFVFMHVVLVLYVVLFFIDVFYIYGSKNTVDAERILPDKLSLGDENIVELVCVNTSNKTLFVRVIDEIPIQFQERDFNLYFDIKPNETKNKRYALTPFQRGEYEFGSLQVFVRSKIGLIERRFQFNTKAICKVYPSFKQLKEKAYLLSDSYFKQMGNKLLKRLGHTLEFEQISNYYQGADIRNINWKATAKKNQLMINQFQDEKSQQVYVVIDKGRTMQMPFGGLSLLDHSINSALFLLNVVNKKEDRAGMFTFSKRIENRVVAERRGNQLQLIQESLYNVNTDFFESNFGKLYNEVNANINHRGLLILFTNFETLDGLQRQLKYLRALAKKHLLLVVFFENSEVNEMTKITSVETEDMVRKVTAEHFVMQKKAIARELNKNNIATVLTTPENLTVDAVNKYLFLKNKGLI